MYNEVNYRIDKDSGALIFQSSSLNAQKQVDNEIDILKKQVKALEKRIYKLEKGERRWNITPVCH